MNSRLDCTKLEPSLRPRPARVAGVARPLRRAPRRRDARRWLSPRSEGRSGVKPPVSPETLVRMASYYLSPLFRVHVSSPRGAGAQDPTPLRIAPAARARSRRSPGLDRRDGRALDPGRPHRRRRFRTRPGRGLGPQGVAGLAHQDRTGSPGHRHRAGRRRRGRRPRRDRPGDAVGAAKTSGTLSAGRARTLPRQGYPQPRAGGISGRDGQAPWSTARRSRAQSFPSPACGRRCRFSRREGARAG